MSDSLALFKVLPNRGTDLNHFLMVSGPPMAVKVTVVGSITYVAKAPVGSSQGSPVWQAKKIDETSGLVITWADSDSKFDNVATDLTLLTYG